MLRVAKSLIIRPGSVTSCVLLLLIGLTTNQLARPILLSANILSTSARRMVRAARSQIFGDANVTPTSGSLTVVVNTTGNHAVFEVDNTDANPENYSLSCVVSSPVTSCDSPPSVFVDGNSSAVVDVLFATGGTGIGGVTLFVGGLGGSSPGHYDVTVQQARIAPTIANMSGGDVRDVSRCVNNCFENVKSYTTPSYVSLDVPRSTTLLYRSGSAHPIANVQFDVTDNSATPADAYELQLQRQDGSYVNFLNGNQAVYFQSSGHYVPTRLAAAFDVTSLPTGRYTYTAIVTSIWNSDSLHAPAYSTVHVIVLNESASPYGAGWTVSGVQRAYVQSDGVLVTDGTGSASFFSGTCAPGTACTFASPGGDFSTFSQFVSVYHRVYPDGTNVTFRLDGRESSQADRFGNSTSFSYDTSTTDGGYGALSTVTDPAGQTTRFTFDLGNGIDGWRDGWIFAPGGRWLIYGIDPANNLEMLQDFDATYAFIIDYDGSHRLTHFKDKARKDWNYTYAADGSVATLLAPGVTINGTPDQRPLTQFGGPSTAIISAIIGTVGTQGNPVPCSLDFRAKITNPRGYTTRYTLNRWGEPTFTQDALLRYAFATYDDNTGQIKTTTSVSGHTVRYTWDGPRETQVHDSATGQTVNTSYETTYNRPTHIWGNTVEQWFFYTGNRIDSSRTGTDTTPATRYSTDSRGRIYMTRDPLGHVDSVTYNLDGFQNTQSKVHSGNRITSYRYDGFGRVRVVQNPLNFGDSTDYDVLNRQVATIDVDSHHKTSFEYDTTIVGPAVIGGLYLRSVTDAKGQRYSYTRNALGWIEQESRAGSANTLITTYDSNGNVVSIRNRRLQTVTFTYDALDRVTSQSGASGTTTFGYGPSNRFSSVSNAESTDTLFYDRGDRDSSAKMLRPDGNWYQITYGYDANGRRAALDATSNTWSGNHGPHFTYYASGALHYIDDFGLRTTVTVNNENQPTLINLPGGLNNTQRWTSVHASYENSYCCTGDANARLGTGSRQDALGRISEWRRVANDSLGDSLQTFHYDTEGRFESRWIWSSSKPGCHLEPDFGLSCASQDSIVRQETYSYDEVGTLMNGVDVLEAGNRIRRANGYDYAYDADGNLTSKTGNGLTQTFDWNELGQLTRVTTNGVVAEFGYDGRGRRVRKSINCCISYGYLHDGSMLFMELYSGIQSEYESVPGADKPLAVATAGQVYFYAWDQTGNARGLIKSSTSNAVSQYGYSPFGQLDPGSFDSAGNNLRFKGGYYDSETGLYLFGVRYYDPQEGRFLSEDPAGVAGGVNLYAFAGDDPINRSDPTGKFVGPRGACSIMIEDCEGSMDELENWIRDTWSRNAFVCKGPSAATCLRDNAGVYVGSWPIPLCYADTNCRHTAVATSHDGVVRVNELIGVYDCLFNCIYTDERTPAYGGGFSAYTWTRVAPYRDIRDALQAATNEFEGELYTFSSNRFTSFVLMKAGISLDYDMWSNWSDMGWAPGLCVYATCKPH